MNGVESVGWVCKNGHYNERSLTSTVCINGWTGGPSFPCGAIKDPRDLYEGVGAAPSLSDNLLIGFNPEKADSETSTVTDQAKRQMSGRRGARRGGGFICFRCAELVPINRSPRMPGSNFEQPGTQIEVFSTKEDLKWHIQTVHKGKRYADKGTRKFRRDSEKKEKAEEKASNLLRGLKRETTKGP